MFPRSGAAPPQPYSRGLRVALTTTSKAFFYEPRIFGEIQVAVQQLRAGVAPARATHCLLDDFEATIQHPKAGMFPGIRFERLTDTSRRVQATFGELFYGILRRFEPDY